MSYNEVSAQLGAGGAFEGWTYATTTQVEGLWTAFGGDPNHYDGWSTQNNGLFDVIAPYVGDLVFGESDTYEAGDGYSWWITATPQEDTTTIKLDVMVTSDAYSNPRAELEDSFGRLQGVGDLPLDYGADYLGSALVRPTAVVPVPPAVWLFGSGLLGLIGVARRKLRV